MIMDEPREIRTAINALEDALKKYATDDVVSCHVFINSHGVEYTLTKRTAESLRRDGVSMRNIAGEWVK